MKFLSVFSGSSRSVLKHNSFRLALGEKSLNKWNGGGCERNDREKIITALILDSEVQFFVPIFKFLFDFIFVVCWWQITVVRSPQSKSIHQPLLASSGSTPRNLVTCTTLTHVLHHSKPHHLRHPLITRPPRGPSTLTTHINYPLWQVFYGTPWLANFLDHLVCAIEKWLTATPRLCEGLEDFFGAFRLDWYARAVTNQLVVYCVRGTERVIASLVGIALWTGRPRDLIPLWQSRGEMSRR